MHLELVEHIRNWVLQVSRLRMERSLWLRADAKHIVLTFRVSAFLELSVGRRRRSILLRLHLVRRVAAVGGKVCALFARRLISACALRGREGLVW